MNSDFDSKLKGLDMGDKILKKISRDGEKDVKLNPYHRQKFNVRDILDNLDENLEDE